MKPAASPGIRRIAFPSAGGFRHRLGLLGWLLAAFLPLAARATPGRFDLPPQPLPAALLAFSQQAKMEVVFSFDELRAVQSSGVSGLLEPRAALEGLLRDTGFAARETGRGKFVVKAARRATGGLRGRLLGEGNGPAEGVRVVLVETNQGTSTDGRGEFFFRAVAPGTYRLTATGPGHRPLTMSNVAVVAGRTRVLETRTLPAGESLTTLEPFIVEGRMTRLRPLERGRIALAARMAGGNLDLPRNENDPLPYRIYEREQIARSGVVSLSDFFALEVLDNEGAGAASGDGDTSSARAQASFASANSSLNLRGYGADQTVILVNGRRLPEAPPYGWGEMAPPDVNFVPLSLVQQIEVLPVSASAIYSGNAVGGVINIVLRPDVQGTEVTGTYTNALHRFSAPQSMVSLQHGETLLGGALRLRFNASFTRSMPPNESELRHRTAHVPTTTPLTEPLFRATPNVRSADGTPLGALGGTSAVTSVASGADGGGGLAAFSGRSGVRSTGWFDGHGSLSASPNTWEFSYGWRDRRESYFASATFDVTPRLQLGLDLAHARTTVNRGYEVLTADLALEAASPANPFGQDVRVSLNETAPLLGDDFSQVRMGYGSAVLGALLKLPADWRATVDLQASRSTARYRGIAGVDHDRWQELADTGAYNPLRDTQVHAAPDSFHRRCLEYFTPAPGRFVTMSDYSTVDVAARLTNQSLPLPTGRGALCAGLDYRRNHLAGFTEARYYADGSPVDEPVQWDGRSLERLSAFGELQAPLLPRRWLPGWMRSVDADAAARYVVADTAKEANVAPVVGLKADLAGGFAFRASVATANRYPTPYMSRRRGSQAGGGGGPAPIELTTIYDTIRQQSYDVQARAATNPDLLPESAVTRTAGLLLERGRVHRLRASIDFVDTRKTNEQVFLGAQTVVDFEPLWPARVRRDPPAPGDTRSAGRIASVTTGLANLAWRHSQNWNASLDYAWTECRGGTLELYGRWICFQRYDRRDRAGAEIRDELTDPAGSTGTLLKHRANFGTSWSNADIGFGIDGHYHHSRRLSALDRLLLGRGHLSAYWQFDAYLQADLARWLPWKGDRHGLRGQIRINNLLNAAYPTYLNAPSGAGVQNYGDWRGRVYSVSMTATF